MIFLIIHNAIELRMNECFLCFINSKHSVFIHDIGLMGKDMSKKGLLTEDGALDIDTHGLSPWYLSGKPLHNSVMRYRPTSI